MIGVFDSGLGGLTALREIRALMPSADLIYFGDTARIPYGTKSKEVIDRYAVQDCRLLCDKGASVVLAACGTVSSNSLPVLRSRFTTPVYGVIEGAVKRACEVAERGNGRVLILGTQATIKSKAFETAVKAQNDKLEVFSAACPMFVPLAESWNISSTDSACRAVASEYLTPFADKEPAAVILGCTHYPLLSELIASFLPTSELISSGKEAARLLFDVIQDRGYNIAESGNTTFYTSDDAHSFRMSAERFFGKPITGEVNCIDVEKVDY